MPNIELLNTIKAPASLVLETLSTEAGLAAIWTKKLKVKPEINHIHEFDFDEGYLTKMKLVTLTKNQMIWECIESDEDWTGTQVVFDLSESDGVTTIILRHQNWRSMNDYFRFCSYHWSMLLYRLKTYCESNKKD